jgi:hypothetical protein
MLAAIVGSLFSGHLCDQLRRYLTGSVSINVGQLSFPVGAVLQALSKSSCRPLASRPLGFLSGALADRGSLPRVE